MSYIDMRQKMLGTDTFDLTDSSVVVQVRPETGYGTPTVVIDTGITQVAFRTNYEGTGRNGLYAEYVNTSGSVDSDYILDPPDYPSDYMFVKIAMSGSDLVWSTSLDGSGFTTQKTLSLSSDEVLYLKSSRLVIGERRGSTGLPGFSDIGSINPSLTPPVPPSALIGIISITGLTSLKV